MRFRTAIGGFLLVLLASISAARDRPGSAAHSPHPIAPGEFSARPARNVIFMVPDGMGLADVTAARIYRNGPGGDPLNLETLAFVGYARNWSADSTITDSAAAASAWACGEKFRNGSICMRPDGSHPASLLEIARDRGRRTGLVATSTITHATPASFGAHVRSRDCETEIARQVVESARVDVILGGGTAKFRTTSPDPCGTRGDFIAAAVLSGYRFVSTRDGLSAAVEEGAERLLGLFAPGALSPEISRPSSSPEPRLPEMAAAALDILEEAPEGFFLMIEGSQIDNANHANNQASQLAELLAFDETVGVVLDWLAESPLRAMETVVIVAPDHETGGFAINGPQGRLLEAGGKVQGAWTSGNHTGGDVPIWSQGPQAWRLARPVDNTDVYAVVADAMR
jgi:alkaline phosphatase